MSKGMDFGGAVKVPAIYELKNEKTLNDLLRLAGGLGTPPLKAGCRSSGSKAARKWCCLMKTWKNF